MLDLSRIWYRDRLTFTTYLLLPFSWLFRFIAYWRRFCYRVGIFKVFHFDVPVIVVGNITVGGTGKTPFVIWLAKVLRDSGYHPGIVSRGYGGKHHATPHLVTPESNPIDVGDEAVLLARLSGAPVVIAVDRVASVNFLLLHEKCDVVITDDGLQHYRLGRDIEIVIVDGKRNFGNYCVLPAGPLREPIRRLNNVDFVITNEGIAVAKWGMTLKPSHYVNVVSSVELDLSHFAGQTVHAVAAIGHPERFFTALTNIGVDVIPHAFPDHYQYQSSDLIFFPTYPVVMTAKDAVKCEKFTNEDLWYLATETIVSDALKESILTRLQKTRNKS